MMEEEEISFEDAQRDPTLLNPVVDGGDDDDLSATLGERLRLQKAKKGQGVKKGTTLASTSKAKTKTATQAARADLQPSPMKKKNGDEDKEGTSVTSKEEVEEAQDEARRKKEWKERPKREEKEYKRERALARQAEERKMAIEKAIHDRRQLLVYQEKDRKEERLFADYTAGRTGNEALGRQINGLWQSSRPTKKQLALRDALIRDAQAVLDRNWPDCGLRLVPFGSTQTGLVEAASDVDLTLLDPMRPLGVGTPSDEVIPSPSTVEIRQLADSVADYGVENLPDYYSVRVLAKCLRKLGGGKFVKVVPISHAKVPIVKFVHAISGLSSDINVNDAFGSVNSDLINAYCDFEKDLVRPFLFTIKKWASRRGFNDPAGKSGACSLNSYTICMIGIQFLQVRKVVPNLQSPSIISAANAMPTYLWQKPPTSRFKRSNVPSPRPVKGAEVDLRTGARRFDTTFAVVEQQDCRSNEAVKAELVRAGFPSDYPPKVKPSEVERHAKLGQLLREFFIWLSEFDFDECGISIRLGGPFRKSNITTKSSKSEEIAQLPLLEPPSHQWKMEEPILCQDPFILDRNTAGAVTKDTRDIIKDECWRAREMLEESASNKASSLLFNLTADFYEEELSSSHALVMQSFDTATREYVVKNASQKAPRKAP